MSARIAVSTTGRNGQYVGTSRTAPPSAELGSATARFFNGTLDRLVGGRSNDLGANFLYLATFWRNNPSPVANDVTAQRLFTQYAIGATRVAVGLNRSVISLTVTSSSGVTSTIESKAKVLDTNRHRIALSVNTGTILVYLDGYEIIRHTTTLAAPDSARVVIGADVNTRFFAGWIDDTAFFQTPPTRTAQWLRYLGDLSDQAPSRDVVAAIFGASVGGAVLGDGGYSAVGATGINPICRITMGQAFRVDPEFPEQSLEFSFVAGADPSAIGVGWYDGTHNFATQVLGVTAGSYLYRQDGVIRRNGANFVSGLPTWTPDDAVALRYDYVSRELDILVNGALAHTLVLPVGVWTPAIQLGPNQVKVNSGQAWPTTLEHGFTGLYSEAHSLLNTEFRNMKLAQVSAPLNDTDGVLRDAYTGSPAGVYIDPVPLEAGITPDSLDLARRVGSGIKVNAGTHTTADENFFFAVAFSPEASDLVAEKVILESPGSWGLKLLDGRLYAWVGDTQVGSIDPALEAGKHYLLGVARSPGGRLLVWTHIGYVLQSGDLTTTQPSRDVWVGSGVDGERAVAGRVSHLVLSATLPAQWKLDRLRQTYTWDLPLISGAIPNPVLEYRVFELNWRDVITLGIDATPDAIDCFVGAVAAAPDATAIEYRLQHRLPPGAGSYDVPRPFTAHGKISDSLGRLESPVQLYDFTDLSGVVVGAEALIGSERVRVDSINQVTGELTISRGCGDTVPEGHGAGQILWFLNNPGRGATEYALNNSPEIRLLSRTALAEIEEGMAPAIPLLMVGRLGRPFPPANVTINDQLEPAFITGTAEVKWRHRNKTTQGSSLVAWTDASVAAPSGVVYRVRAYDQVNGTMLHESPALASTVESYNLYVEYHGPMTVEVVSVEGAFECLQAPRLSFEYDYQVIALMMTEAGDAFIGTEDNEGVIELEKTSSLRAGSYNGELPTGGIEEDGDEEEEEEEEGGTTVVGVPISEFAEFPDTPSGLERIPLIMNDDNYNMTFQQLLTWITSQISLPQDGKDAYQLWLEAGNTGTLEDFFEAYRGYRGLNSNLARRIQTITSASGAVVCNWENFDEIRMRLTGDVTLTFVGAVNGQGCMIKFEQDAVGGRTVTLPTQVRYNALVPSFEMNPNPGKIDKLAFIFDAGDSRYDLQGFTPGVE